MTYFGSDEESVQVPARELVPGVLLDPSHFQHGDARPLVVDEVRVLPRGTVWVKALRRGVHNGEEAKHAFTRRELATTWGVLRGDN